MSKRLKKEYPYPITKKEATRLWKHGYTFNPRKYPVRVETRTGGGTHTTQDLCQGMGPTEWSKVNGFFTSAEYINNIPPVKKKKK